MIKTEAIDQELLRLNNLLKIACANEWDGTISFARDRITELEQHLKTPVTPLEIIDAELSRLHTTYKLIINKPDLKFKNQIQDEVKEMINKLQAALNNN